MRHWQWTPRLAFAAMLLLPVHADGQTVRGRVLGELDGRPIAQAHVAVLAGSGAGVIVSRLSPDGSFLFDLPDAGAYRLRVEALGYFPLTTEPLDVPARTVISLELRLRADAIALDPVRVVGERPEPPFMQDVRRRHRLGFGRLITREQLDERFGSRMQDVLRDAGLKLTELQLPGDMRLFPLVTARLTATASRDCYTDLYLNGVRQFTSDPGLDPEALERAWELFQFRPQDVEAVEIYRGAAEVPAEYSGSTAQCGVVAVWLRSGYESAPVGAGVYAGPLPQVALTVTRARYTYTGTHAPARGTGYEAAAYWRLRGGAGVGAGIGAGIGVRTRYGSHELSAETMQELLRGTRVMESGPRPLSVIMLGIEPRVVLLEHWPVRPVLAGRIAVARRRFEVPDPRVPRARPPSFTSHAWGWGGAAGAELALLRGVSLEAAVAHERLRFGAYGALETRSRPTASDWRTTVLRLGLATRL